MAALYVLPTRDPSLRIGFSVSKKVGKSTIRNRVKRLMREAVRQELRSLRVGQDLVFIARPAAAGASYDQVAATIARLLDKSGARSPHNA